MNRALALLAIVGLLANAPHAPAMEQAAVLPRPAEFRWRWQGSPALVLAGVTAVAALLALSLATGLPLVGIVGATAQVKILGAGRAKNDAAMARRDAELGMSPVGRDNAMLTDDEFRLVDDAVIEVLREELKFGKLYAQAGVTEEPEGANPGKTSWQIWRLQDTLQARRDMTGEHVLAGMPVFSPEDIDIPVHYVDWQIPWRALEAWRAGGMGKEAIAGREALAVLGKLLEDFYAKGDSDLGIDGLLNRTSRQTFDAPVWSTAGNAYDTAVEMETKWEEKFVNVGRKALFVNSADHKNLQKVFSSTSRSQKKEILDAGVMEEVIVTSQRSSGTATAARVGPATVRHIVTQPVIVEEIGKIGKSPVLRAWTTQTQFVLQADAVVDGTTI